MNAAIKGDIQTALMQACADVGIEYRNVPADGQWHPTDITDDPRGKNDGRIKLFTDGVGGVVMNWKGGYAPFFADDGRTLTDAEKAERMRRADAARAEAEAERQKKASHAATLAITVWQKSKPATADHPYLRRKGVEPTSKLHELEGSSLARLIGYEPKAGGEPLTGRILIAPVVIDGKPATLEMIDEAGRKSALYGGAKAGGYWRTGDMPESGYSGAILICEGVATAISAHMATGHIALAALSCGNLRKVAEAMRALYPDAGIVVCADLGNGQGDAERAAYAVGGRLVIPSFEDGAEINGKPPTDINDIHVLSGLDAVRTCIDVAAPVDKPPADDVTKQSYGGGRFELTARGVFYIGTDKDGNEKSPMFLCSPLAVVAKTRDAKSHAWGRLLEWRDDDGKTHRWAMPLDLLQGDGSDVRRELAGMGLSISPNRAAREMLASYIQVWKVESRACCVDRLGWHGHVYVTADESIGEDREIVVFQNAHAIEPALSVAGTVDDWRQSVGALAAGNSRIVFALSVAFAGALADVAGEDSGGFHLRGGSSSGKTTALKVAASVWGNPSAYVRMWRATANGLEGLAALHNDGVLILDELSQIDPREAGDAAYLLANGQGKARASRTGTARQAARWRLLFLSAGEESLSALMARVGKRANAGQEIRLADIEADAGAGMGAFECLHDHSTPAEMALAIKDAASRYYGAVGIAWLRFIVGDRMNLADFLSDGVSGFVADVLPDGAAGQVQRVARRFALVAAAGELATHYGLTGWAHGESERAAKACFAAWLEAFGGAGNREERAMLAQVRAFFETHGASRFEDMSATTDQRIINRAGFYRTGDDGSREYIVLPEAFRREVCQGFDTKAITGALLAAGWVEAGKDGKATQKPRLPGMGPTRCYVFTARMWEGDL
jgi:uncharacterized protein (DUF927 family)/phage/plasmid primase-like uncharacterized protein